MPKKHDKNRPHWFSPVWCCVSLPPSFSSCPSRCPHRRSPGGSITVSCSSLSHRRGSLITPAVKTVKGLQARILYSGSSVRRCCPNVVPVFNSIKTSWDHWDSLAEKQRGGEIRQNTFSGNTTWEGWHTMTWYLLQQHSLGSEALIQQLNKIYRGLADSNKKGLWFVCLINHFICLHKHI